MSPLLREAESEISLSVPIMRATTPNNIDLGRDDPTSFFDSNASSQVGPSQPVERKASINPLKRKLFIQSSQSLSCVVDEPPKIDAHVAIEVDDYLFDDFQFEGEDPLDVSAFEMAASQHASVPLAAETRQEANIRNLAFDMPSTPIRTVNESARRATDIPLPSPCPSYATTHSESTTIVNNFQTPQFKRPLAMFSGIMDSRARQTPRYDSNQPQPRERRFPGPAGNLPPLVLPKRRIY
jgi:hypothetical protein